MHTTTLPSGGTLTYLDRADINYDLSLPRLGWIVPQVQFRSMGLHHTVSIWSDKPGLGDERAFMRGLQTIRPDLGLDVPYHFVLFRQASDLDAVVCEGRGWERTGAHTKGRNSTTYGVACAGDFRFDRMTQGMVEAVRWIGTHIKHPEATWGHRDAKATICPGNNIYNRLHEMQPPFIKDTTMDPTLQARVDELEAIIRLTKDPKELVERCYLLILGRKPDKVGFDFWVKYLVEGGSVATMVGLFEMSPERSTS